MIQFDSHSIFRFLKIISEFLPHSANFSALLFLTRYFFSKRFCRAVPDYSTCFHRDNYELLGLEFFQGTHLILSRGTRISSSNEKQRS